MTVLRIGAGGLAEANQLRAIGLIYSAMRSTLSPTIAAVQVRGWVHGPQNHGTTRGSKGHSRWGRLCSPSTVPSTKHNSTQAKVTFRSLLPVGVVCPLPIHCRESPDFEFGKASSCVPSRRLQPELGFLEVLKAGRCSREPYSQSHESHALAQQTRTKSRDPEDGSPR